jgi:hypothetical protein
MSLILINKQWILHELFDRCYNLIPEKRGTILEKFSLVINLILEKPFFRGYHFREVHYYNPNIQAGERKALS